MVSVWSLLGLGPARMLLTATDERLSAEPPDRFARAWLGLMCMGLLWGIVLANVWGLVWAIFRDTEPLMLPAVATSACFCLGPFRRALAVLTEMLAPKDGAARAVAGAMLVLVVTVCLAKLRPDFQRWEAAELPWWLGWLRPDAKLYRVLLLMPLWGAWAMLIALKFRRPSAPTEPQVSAVARGCGAPAAAGCMALLLLATIAYFSHLGPWGQAVILLGTILTAIAAGVGFSIAAGAVCRRALLAANVTTQVAFVLAYLAGREIPTG